MTAVSVSDSAAVCPAKLSTAFLSMSGLLMAGADDLAVTSIAQGTLCSYFSLLACFCLHAGSVFFCGPARNVLFLGVRTT